MTYTDISLRLAAALVAGVFLGLEREKRGRAAGLRTTTLVCCAAAVAMILSTELPLPTLGIGFGGDPARLAAGVLAGMGFLGAGVIVRQDPVVRGVTTAAVLWFASIVGLAFGSGHFFLGAISTVLAFAVLVGLPRVERRMRDEVAVVLSVVMDPPGLTRERLEVVLATHRLQVQTYAVTRERERVVYSVRIVAPQGTSLTLPDIVTRELLAFPEVRSAEWHV